MRTTLRPKKNVTNDMWATTGSKFFVCNMCAKKQAGIIAALALLEGVMFGGQTHDSSDAINEAYDILKAASVDNEEEDMRPESRTKSRYDPAAIAPAAVATIPAPSRAKPLSKKRPKNTSAEVGRLAWKPTEKIET
ncbi:hypothetical protein LguiA_004333 [Lonicera macranthoides]